MKISCDPKQWGGAAWQFLHSIALCYPEYPTNKDKERFKMFFLVLPYVLPCLQCQQHLLQFISKNIQNFEKAFENNINLRKFIIDMHNHVNKRLRKPLLTYKEMGIKCVSKECVQSKSTTNNNNIGKTFLIYEY